VKVCVVGNGPSATDRSNEIDACDFVVRLKQYWLHGAENAGRKIHALAWFGEEFDGASDGYVDCEHWFTQSPSVVFDIAAGGFDQGRIAYFNRVVNLRQARWATDAMLERAYRHLGKHPSCGFTAIDMALALFAPCELVLYGYDSTTLDRPNYADARYPLPEKFRLHPPHDMLAEKRAIAELGEGCWLGAAIDVELVWPDKPELP